ncbi:MAG: HAMP domain-containing histidine kinase [Acidimicrobiales bacterium]|nr:HAMP domain-containing histidine kinase [Acidimicrobiales bacterium]
MSLRARLALILGATVALTVALASTAGYVLTRNELRQQADELLETRAEAVTRELERREERFERRREPSGGFLLPGERLDVAVQVIAPDGDIASVPIGVQLPVSDRARAVARGDAERAVDEVAVDGVPYLVLTRSAGELGAAQVGIDRSSDDAVLRGLRARLLLLGVLGTAAAAAIGWIVAGRTVQPVRQLTGAAEHMATTSELADPIPVHGDDEVARLAVAFNQMLDALAQSRAQQQRLVQDASHELRTPLTSLRTNAEVLRSADRLDPDDRRRLLDDVTAEVDELTDLVRELVELAQDAGPTDEPLRPVALEDIVREVASRAERRTDRTITVTARQPATVQARPAQLTRAVANLVGNATKFSPPDTAITVEVTGTRVAVVDHGPGIAVADQDHVFERFWRSEQARSAPGSGLGLAIVDQIVRAHEGRTFVAETPGGGATVGFELPDTTGAPPAPDPPTT